MIPLGVPLTVPALFAAGLASSLHCTFMCGALNAAQARTRGAVGLNQALLLIHGGRVAGYAGLGAAAGALGQSLIHALPATAAGGAVQAAAAAALIGIGLRQWRAPARAAHDACHVPRAGFAARFPARLRLPLQGLCWALLPCGILYGALLLAAFSGGALSGALLLLAFGLGTLPLLYAGGGLFAATARPSPQLRRVSGLALVALGLASFAAVLLHPAWLPGLWCHTPA
ncbi:MAG: sulfite exporter TauE/SafE family protein [Nevskia sp.]|nr:sulfite exporter TauE/SafE family protein [Nevskia sp.]